MNNWILGEPVKIKTFQIDEDKQKQILNFYRDSPWNYQTLPFKTKKRKNIYIGILLIVKAMVIFHFFFLYLIYILCLRTAESVDCIVMSQNVTKSIKFINGQHVNTCKWFTKGHLATVALPSSWSTETIWVTPLCTTTTTTHQRQTHTPQLKVSEEELNRRSATEARPHCVDSKPSNLLFFKPFSLTN